MKILFQCMDSCGHIAAGIGFAEALAARGHQVTFLVSELHRNRFTQLGFGEMLLKLDTSQEGPAVPIAESMDAVKLTAEQLKRNGLLSGASPLEKMKGHNAGEKNFLDTLCQKLAHFDAQIEAAIEKEKPDLIICNQFLTPPAILRAGIYWIFQVTD